MGHFGHITLKCDRLVTDLSKMSELVFQLLDFLYFLKSSKVSQNVGRISQKATNCSNFSTLLSEYFSMMTFPPCANQLN